MSEPTWWKEAQALELNDELEAAEKKLKDHIHELGCFAQLAHLYELRMNRKLAEGNRAAAEEAFRKSVDWIRFMASCATSGGEGIALSQEADEHEARLKDALGG